MQIKFKGFIDFVGKVPEAARTSILAQWERLTGAPDAVTYHTTETGMSYFYFSYTGKLEEGQLVKLLYKISDTLDISSSMLKCDIESTKAMWCYEYVPSHRHWVKGFGYVAYTFGRILHIPTEEELSRAELEFLNQERFYLRGGVVDWVYYNPNSVAGGQFVTNTFDLRLLEEAMYDGTQTPESVFAYIGANCRQELSDRGTEFFTEEMERTDTPIAIGLTEETLTILRDKLAN